jgi:phenylpropionate dioxygenase-like ring-hydroxylating dioxygenase large terminal subunit
MPGFPYNGFPEGWFLLGWSDEFATGKIEARRYFGQDLAVFRTESGRLAATDAYCPHMGANLTVGGRIKGECIACPFHGWEWHADGQNTLIPYSDKVLSNARIRTWHVVEDTGLVWFWYSWEKGEPRWAAPSIAHLHNGRFFWDPDASRRLWSRVRLVPQMVAENIVDGPHIQFVHGATEGGHIANLAEDGKRFLVELDQTFMTRRGPVLGKDHIECYGVGVQTAQMEFRGFRIVNVLGTTPVEEDRCDMRASIFVELPEDMVAPNRAADLPTIYQTAIKSHLDSQDQDLPLWESMRYQSHPLLVAEELEGHARFRKWARQFYQTPREAT